ncbi:MAG: tryptophan synthase subunit alpha [Bacteroidia bacterium]|nr:tryptophan synthase subunit alpha [Bacteroidia bacterium]
MNRIDKMFQSEKNKILSVYFTAGYPTFDSVEEIILLLEKNNVDMIELGIPYSDPLADGPVIQETGKIAIANGMTLKHLFLQLKNIRKKTSIPLLLMGYFNPVLQFGFDLFCMSAEEAGIDGLIIPDLPLPEYEEHYKEIIGRYNLKIIFLITPDTSWKRIKQIDELSNGFIYMVSSSSTTGKMNIFNDDQLNYFARIASMKLRNPILVGFGIHNRETLEQVYSYCDGAIVGSAFMRELQRSTSIEDGIKKFFKLF